MATIFTIGVIVRVSLLSPGLHRVDLAQVSATESYSLATCLAKNGTYADAFGQGVGPTAHLAPILPILLAMIIKVTGGGLAGYLVRTILASIASSAAFALLPALPVKCRMGTSPGVTAGLIGALIPINYFNQTLTLFENPYTMLGLVGLCVMLSRRWIEERFSIRSAIPLGILSGFLCLLSPTILAVLAGWYLFGMLHFAKSRKAFSIFWATVAAIVVICLSPWAYRNYKALGAPVWTRSNFGLELAVSNNDSVTAEEEKNSILPDFPHPFIQLKEREKVRQIGELAYVQARQKEALSWIRDHPARFSQLTMLRFFYWWFPRMHRLWQTIAEALISVLAIAGLLCLFKNKHPLFWMFLAVPVFYQAVYLVIEVGPRYRVPIEPILLFLACYLCLDLWGTMREIWKPGTLVPAKGE
jgi:hypothetical protein